MSGRWLVLRVKSPSDELTPLLAEGLVASGGSAVLEEGDTLTTFVSVDEDGRRALVTRVGETLAAIAGTRLDVAAEWQAHEDWTERWREGLAPRRISDRLIVSPSWCAPDASPGEVLIVIDPEMAFGTGEHATTRGALRLLERALVPGATVLDMGTGSGILAIAAVLLGATHVDAPELDADSLPYARANADRHGVGDRIAFEHTTVDAAYLLERIERYDVVTANVLSGVLLPLLPGMRGATRSGGSVIVGGILAEESATMIDAAHVAGLSLEAEDREDAWWTGWFRGPIS
jgi:ribosomal protein L11 methyltransferase